MSGWDAYDWADAALATFMIVTGLIFLFRRTAASDDRADDWQLRYGNGAGLRRLRWGDRMTGVILLGVGVLNLLDGRATPREPGFAIGMGVLAVAGGLWILFFEQRFARWRQRRYATRLTQRLATGEDAYFEELRAMRSYPVEPVEPSRHSREKWVAGAFILAGISFLALGLIR